jgi:hypothetical protein
MYSNTRLCNHLDDIIPIDAQMRGRSPDTHYKLAAKRAFAMQYLSYNTLVYKRTHRGDPDKSGTFGINDCMGRVRTWPFDAVIGVGGKMPDAGHEDIANKINWVGIKPRIAANGLRGPILKFEYFLLLESEGPELKTFAPDLFRYMFEDHNVRLVTSKHIRSPIMRLEIGDILKWAIEEGHLNKASAKSVSQLHRSPISVLGVCKKRNSRQGCKK